MKNIKLFDHGGGFKNGRTTAKYKCDICGMKGKPLNMGIDTMHGHVGKQQTHKNSLLCRRPPAVKVWIKGFYCIYIIFSVVFCSKVKECT